MCLFVYLIAVIVELRIHACRTDPFSPSLCFRQLLRGHQLQADYHRPLEHRRRGLQQHHQRQRPLQDGRFDHLLEPLRIGQELLAMTRP